jgi:hypothetical protein
MNTNVKLLIGATVGAGIGYFVGAVIADIIYLREHPYEDDYHDTPEYNGDEVVNETKLFERSQPKMPKKVKNYEKAFKANPDLEKLVKKYSSGTPPEGSATLDLLEVADDFNTIEDETHDFEPISIISMTEFANAEGFDCQTLNYWDDDIVTDQHNNPIDRPEQILGDEALISFGELSEDPDVVYVRNLNNKAMYEIVRMNKEFTAERLGRANRKQAALKQLKKEEDDGEVNT